MRNRILAEPSGCYSLRYAFTTHAPNSASPSGPVDEDSLEPSLLSGDFSGSAAFWKDTERERVLLYSQPYLENRLILVGRQGSDVSANSLADLAGKRIALVAGYAYGRRSRRGRDRSLLARTAKRTASQDSSTVRQTTR
ncbi:MAG: transporter substrate-binding domain-containing protein [Bryobacterales bacterium]|nr:transporter substrate-binding domain-containing protein [Bryobacterales bacterium]